MNTTKLGSTTGSTQLIVVSGRYDAVDGGSGGLNGGGGLLIGVETNPF
jgi:hypothetical protein